MQNAVLQYMWFMAWWYSCNSEVHPLSTDSRLTCIATAVLDGATTSDVGRVEGITLDGVARVLPAFLDHELDDIHVDGGPEDGLQLLLGRLAQETLTALVGEEYLEGYGTRSSC